jgi:molybdenum cofactor cytidylyltransferase
MRGAPVVGILLAAGSATRFGAAKLLVPLPDGTPIGIAALENLAAAVDTVVAVVRIGDDALATVLAAHGARVTAFPRAAEGMGESLAWGVRAAPAAAAWLIALADMPWVQPATVGRIGDALRQGARIAAPTWQGARGHPVGFAASLYAELIALTGDEGAKSVVARHGAFPVAIEDAGVLRDIDTPQDLERGY